MQPFTGAITVPRGLCHRLPVDEWSQEASFTISAAIRDWTYELPSEQVLELSVGMQIACRTMLIVDGSILSLRR